MIVFIVFTVHSDAEALQWNTKQLPEPVNLSGQEIFNWDSPQKKRRKKKRNVYLEPAQTKGNTLSKWNKAVLQTESTI